MTRRITVQRLDEQKERIAIALVVGISVLLMMGVWMFQWQQTVQGGLFTDIANEFEETSRQVEAGLDLAEETAAILGEPLDLYNDSNKKPSFLPVGAANALLENIADDIADKMNKQKYASLPVANDIVHEETIEEEIIE